MRNYLVPMLWSMFPQTEVQRNASIDFMPKFEGADIRFDIVVPEYRIAIDVLGDKQDIPAITKNTVDTSRRLMRHEFDKFKERNLDANNYRYIKVPPILSKARNILIEQINEFHTLARSGAPSSLLTPRLPGDAGWDIICSTDTVCAPQSATDIASDLYMEIPNHLYAIVQARSSTSKKRMVILPGVIDPGYRGEIFVMAYNLTSEPITIKKGDRIAQLLFFSRVPHLHTYQVYALRNSERGSSGFGSTGT
jgi:dUTP pyrophosphatase